MAWCTRDRSRHDLSAILGERPLSEETWRYYIHLDERTRRIALARIAPVRPLATLEELGNQLGVTRERVRQLERGARERLGLTPGMAAPAVLVHHAARVNLDLGPVQTSEAVDAALIHTIRLTSGALGPDELELRSGLLRRLTGRLEHGCLSVTPEAAVALRKLEEDANRLHAGTEIVVPEHLRPSGWPEGVAAEIDRLVSGRRFEGQLIRWGRSHGDRAVALLRVRGRALSADDIHQGIDPRANPRSVLNAVQADQRLKRIGVDLYALHSDDRPSYRGIEKELIALVAGAAGRLALENAVETLTNRFGVAAASVRSYARSPALVCEGGMVRLRGRDEAREVKQVRPPGESRSVFRVGATWTLRLIVDSEALRGSGQLLNQTAALTAGIEPDLSIETEFDGASVIFGWEQTQPYLGSIRALARHHGCTDGDALLLPLEGAEPRPIIVVRGAEVRGLHGLRRLAAELGIVTDDDEHAVDELAAALDLPTGADAVDIADRLRRRGDPGMSDVLDIDGTPR